jgi:hypothetical protein
MRFPLEFKTLLTWSSATTTTTTTTNGDLIKLGEVTANLFLPEDLEKQPNLLREQEKYLNFYLDDDDDYDKKIIFINKTNGTLWVNLTHLITQTNIEITFNVRVQLKHSNLEQSSLLKCSIQIQNAHAFDLLALKRGYFHANQIKLEKQLDQVKLMTRRNDDDEEDEEEIFNLNRILFNTSQTPHDIVYKLEDTNTNDIINSLPFEIRLDTGQLVPKAKFTFNFTHNPKLMRTFTFYIRVTLHLRVNIRLILNTNSNSMLKHFPSEILTFNAPNTCSNSYFIGCLNTFFIQNADEQEYRFVMADTNSNEIIFLNESTGEIYCNRNQVFNVDTTTTYGVEVYAKINRNFKQFFFFKSLIINLNLYENSLSDSSSSEHLIYEIKLSENTRVNTLVWSMPFSISLRYEHRCSIITGNIFDTFYLNRRQNGGLALVRELDFMLKPVFNLVIRCTSSQMTPMEIDMELNVEIVKENFYAYVLAQNLLVFDADVYEFSIGFNEDNNNGDLRVLGKVNAFYPRLVKNERIVYRYLTSDESLLEFQKVFLLNEYTGQVYVNVKNFNENFSRYCLDVNNIDTLKMSAYFFITVKAFNQVIEKRIELKLPPPPPKKKFK